MRIYIKQQVKEIDNWKESDFTYYYRVMRIIEHERLIHLIITILTAIFFFGFGYIFLIGQNIITTLLFLAFTILLLFYIEYYCFCENSIQKMYKIYDENYKKFKSKL